MKFLDEKGKIFGKVNLFDLLVLLIVAVAVIGMGSRLILKKIDKTEYNNASIVFELTNCQENITEAYQIGDTIYEGGVEIGTVTKLDIRPYETTELMADGSSKLVTHPLTYFVKLTVETDHLEYSKEGYMVASQEILNGTTHYFANGFINGAGIIRSITIHP